MDLSVFFEEAKRQILLTEERRAEAAFYLDGLKYREARPEEIVVSVPSALFRDQVKKFWIGKLEETIRLLTGRSFTILIEVENTLIQPTENSVPSAGVAQVDHGRSLEWPYINLNKDDSTEVRSNLNPEMTFDSYVIGEENKLAYSTAVAVSKNPGGEFNPLFLYGGVGLGKTHLMNAIGNAIKQQNPNAKVLCITSENFVNDFVRHVLNNSHKNNSMKKFKEFYRNLDVLLIDDIYDLQGKEESQEELFHTFNQLYDNKKQMVFTCDRPPKELKKFNERLISRFVRGAIRDLKVPSWETRYAILKKKSSVFNIIIPDEVLRFVATSINSNVRDLESALINIKSYAELIQKEITIEVAQKCIQTITGQPQFTNITIETIQRVTAEIFNVTVKDLKDKRKTQAIVLPRQVAMYVAQQLTELSTTEIGLEFGGRDHTTVMHAIKKIDSLIKTDVKIDSLVQSIISKCKEHHQYGP